MVAGEWQMKESKSSLEVTQFDVWAWGPGKHSMRVRTDGSGGDGKPWRELEVLYWHPGRKQICILGLVPHGWGVAEGTIQFKGEAMVADIVLYQHGNRRVLGARRTFDGLDHVHEALLEGGTTPLAEWDWFRSDPATSFSAHPLPAAPELTESLRVLAPLIGHAWSAEIALVTGESFGITSTVDWVPHSTGVEARVSGSTPDGVATELLDVYFYDHTGREGLRCLALSAWGAVYEGDVTVLEGGALQIDMLGYHRDEVVPHTVRLDFGEDGALRDRVWSVQGAERTLLFDARHEKQDQPPVESARSGSRS